mmetsp:Transcript_12919/g.21938  ORF Transcript_12919/g.21938 Transcript_12919/m.21938 type:complete len:480 (-) Transcript_12919:384-1823(-)
MDVQLLSSSPTVPLSTFLFPLALLAGYCWYFYDEWKKSKRIRYPTMAPGGFFHVLFKFWDVTVADYLLSLIREHGGPTKVIQIPLAPPGKHFFVVGEATVARQVLENPQTTKFLPIYSMFDPITGGPTFFTSNGPRFKHARKSTNSAFAAVHVAGMAQVAQTLTDEWIQQKLEGKEHGMDVSYEMQRLTLKIIAKVAFDYDLTEEEILRTQTNLDVTLREYIIDGQKNPLRKYLSWFIPKVRQAQQSSQELQLLGAKILRQYRDSEHPSHNTVLHAIATNDEYKSDAEHIGDIIVYLSAGYDSTSAAVGWTLLELAKNPDIQTWLRKELQKVSSKEERVQCPALMHVVRESMRLNPPSGVGSVRVTAQDISLQDGTWMPAGSTCMTCVYVIQRDGDIFERPDEFLPSRWKNPTPAMQKSWIVFSAGRRNCQGQALANAELHVVLASLVADYEWTVVKEGRRELYATMKTVGTVLLPTKV